MKTYYYIVFILFFQLSFSQSLLRKNLKGQVVNDSIKVDNVVVFNINNQKGTTVYQDGSFEIEVRENDTLFFSSLYFLPEKVLITSREIEKGNLIVPLEAFVNKLQEVVVKSKVKPRLDTNRNIVDTQYYGDSKSSVKNPFIYTGEIQNGVDFVRIFKDIGRAFKKKKKEKQAQEILFTDLVMKKIDYDFYKTTLKLKDEEIRLFLFYCEKGEHDFEQFNTKTNFEIMNFLIEKNKEYQKFKMKK
ncbi:hypothetical protein [Flavobacterium capsici]|uniref:Carboxypeptidase-like regulatory domain-containing protein n=1 Tax=Flavobacterium capsici TaxID=3075618 RepID=A0AA96EVF0_9FLAO|nr:MULTISPECIES: hypothetical protein [unclassified Flavobacterium]WNM19209.1 hypothetical protein RN608_00660 [Flavobacterium sp. PMR2A8]WNM20598.1 hypothetical protein RN605_07830 [Flavobacterium sp. PMTSA4]